jgi:hypothetical protein
MVGQNPNQWIAKMIDRYLVSSVKFQALTYILKETYYTSFAFISCILNLQTCAYNQTINSHFIFFQQTAGTCMLFLYLVNSACKFSVVLTMHWHGLTNKIFETID